MGYIYHMNKHIHIYIHGIYPYIYMYVCIHIQIRTNTQKYINIYLGYNSLKLRFKVWLFINYYLSQHKDLKLQIVTERIRFLGNRN